MNPFPFTVQFVSLFLYVFIFLCTFFNKFPVVNLLSLACFVLIKIMVFPNDWETCEISLTRSEAADLL